MTMTMDDDNCDERNAWLREWPQGSSTLFVSNANFFGE
jgi:hypothetical protein